MPYKIAGYDVRLVTLPEKDVFTYKPPANVYGILAAPPCTEFSKAKGSHPRDFENAMRIVKACLNIVWLCRLRNPLAFWCLENPVGFLRQFLGKPPLTIEHWWYGADIKKPTDLWGYYNFPNSNTSSHRSYSEIYPLRTIGTTRHLKEMLLLHQILQTHFLRLIHDGKRTTNVNLKISQVPA